jgi:predicted acetyltransferase
MTPQFEYTTLAHTEDVQQLGYILEQCYPSGDSEIYINRIGVENFRIIHQDKQVVGGLATLAMGQWWGGQRVPMTGIAAVGIAPEYRGNGAAIALMQHTLKELHTEGIPISFSIQLLNASTEKQDMSKEVVGAVGKFRLRVSRCESNRYLCNL